MNSRIQKIFAKISVAILLSCSPPLWAEDLITIYGQALERDAELLIAEANYLAAIQALPQARAGRLPQILFDANTTQIESSNSTTGDSDNTTTGYSVNLTQSLYDTEVGGDIDVAEATSAAELARLRAARQGLILRVAETYFAILAAGDSVQFAYAERTAIARQLEQAKKRFEVGLIAITDVKEAQARFDSAEAQAILAENVLENSLQALVVITGNVSIKQLATLGERLDLSLPEPANAQAWVELALKNNPELIAAQQSLRAARYERDKNARAGYPTIDLVASYADREVEDTGILGDSDQDDVTIGIELEIPLYTGGRITSEKRQALYEYRAAQNTAMLQNRVTSQQARVAYLDVVSGISQVNALKQALESSNIALAATQAGFEVGTRTSVDVLVSLREIFRAERDFASARYDYLINTLRLRQAAGTLQEDDLFRINRWLLQ